MQPDVTTQDLTKHQRTIHGARIIAAETVEQLEGVGAA